MSRTLPAVIQSNRINSVCCCCDAVHQPKVRLLPFVAVCAVETRTAPSCVSLAVATVCRGRCHVDFRHVVYGRDSLACLARRGRIGPSHAQRFAGVCLSCLVSVGFV